MSGIEDLFDNLFADGSKISKKSIKYVQNNTDDDVMFETTEETSFRDGGISKEVVSSMKPLGCGHSYRPGEKLSTCGKCGKSLCEKCGELRCSRCFSILCVDCAKGTESGIFCASCRVLFYLKKTGIKGAKGIHKVLSEEIK